MSEALPNVENVERHLNALSGTPTVGGRRDSL